MIRFECDYITGAHPKVLQALVDSNLEPHPGYGEDEYCARAAQLIRELCQAPEADVHFLVGGTQTNTTVIASALRPHQGVISTELGHIALHETGAIESTGHKVLTVPTQDGKLTAQQVEQICREHLEDEAMEHKVQPGMVYLSHPTELGTVYTRAELEAICAAAHRYHIPVFVDGARLAYGLAASDITMPDLARLADVFYIGGTKSGALFGEAVVITNDSLKRDFRYFIKQRGALLAKGRLLGVQFLALLSDGLYEQIGQQAVAQALRIKKAFQDKGWPFLVDSPTNQQFVVVPDPVYERIRQSYSTEHNGKPDPDHTAIRFCTTWSTRDEDIDALIRDIQAL